MKNQKFYIFIVFAGLVFTGGLQIFSRSNMRDISIRQSKIDRRLDSFHRKFIADSTRYAKHKAGATIVRDSINFNQHDHFENHSQIK